MAITSIKLNLDDTKILDRAVLVYLQTQKDKNKRTYSNTLKSSIMNSIHLNSPNDFDRLVEDIFQVVKQYYKHQSESWLSDMLQRAYEI